jgi:hypothetical protein
MHDQIGGQRREAVPQVVELTGPGGTRTRALHGWPLAEGSLAPAELRALRVLLAFTESEPGSSAAWRLREGARPSWPGELDYLGYGFPALATYLVVHGFSERRDG